MLSCLRDSAAARLLLAAAIIGTGTRAAAEQIALGGFPGPAGSSDINPQAMSGDGSTVVGTFWGRGFNHGFRWTLDGGLEDLALLPGGSIANSTANGVSFDGSVIVGSGYNFHVEYSAGRWIDGVALSFNSPGTHVRGVSADGNITVGGVFGPQFIQACIWQADSSMTLLEQLPGAAGSIAVAASADGAIVVGRSETTNGNRAVRWTSSGIESLGTLPGGTRSDAYDVSGDGTIIVGMSDGLFDGLHATRWSGSGPAEDLGTLPGADSCFARAVSADGSTIVGSAYDSASGISRPFLWTESSGMVDLASYLTAMGVDLSGWLLVDAIDVSDDGSVIMGWGGYNGEQYGWVVSGIPAPGSAVLLALAAGTTLSRRRRA